MVSGIGRRLIIAIVLGVVVFAGFGLYTDLGALGENLALFAWHTLPLAMLLVIVNYAIRFWRWHYYLRVIDVSVPLGDSLNVFLAGFVMSVTPAKMGELLKSYLLREAHAVPMARTAPVVVAERLTDFIALVILCSIGLYSFDYGVVVVAVCGAISAAVVVLISSRRLAHACIALTRKMPVVKRFSDKFLEMYDSMAELVRPVPLLVATGMSVAAWVSECYGVYLLCTGFGSQAAGVSVTLAFFVHGFATIFGAVTMLPGGLGVTEGSMTGLLVLLGKMEKSPAFAVTLLVRICTLWFGVTVGMVAFLRWRRRRPAQLVPMQEQPAPVETKP